MKDPSHTYGTETKTKRQPTWLYSQGKILSTGVFMTGGAGNRQDK